MARSPRKKAPQGPVQFNLSDIFPEYPRGSGTRGPLEKQALVFYYIVEDIVTGGGVVYQGGKGSGKTIIGAAADVFCHHHPDFKGMDSLIGRETYAALRTSTAAEYFKIIDRLPAKLIKGASRPSSNSMGWVDWAIGGTTFLCSLNNSDAWESANLGFAWVDEAHRQDPEIVGDLETRLRHENGPRVMLCTTNPHGHGYLWRWANPDPRNRSLKVNEQGIPTWRWIEAPSTENPTLPPDYISRLISRYGRNTPAFKRWVLGQSSALEGSVLTDFAPNVEDCIHVVPPLDLPKTWDFGRGMDYGLVNPTAVVWAAQDPYGGVWVDWCHYAPAKPEDREIWTIETHAEVIRDVDTRYKNLNHTPADPSMFAKIHQNTVTGLRYATSDQFWEHGVQLYPADNDRESGLSELLDLVAIDPEAVHPVSLEKGSPRIFIVDRECNEPVIEELTDLQWANPSGTSESGRKDDVAKKKDHAYDALRYLIKDFPRGVARARGKDLVRVREEKQVLGSRGQVRSY